MKPIFVCPHAVASGLCALCVALPIAKPLLEAHPAPVVAIIGTNQRIHELDNPNERAGAEFFQQPIQSFVSSLATTGQAFISTPSGLRAFKLK